MRVKNLEDIYELSPMQQGMLFHILYPPKSELYFEQNACTLHGDLNIPAFLQAWQRVVDRHPVLRTAFFWEAIDKPLQVVNGRVQLPLVEQDWRELPPGEQQAQLEAYLKADRRRGFELSEAPLMRLFPIRVAEDAYYFIWSFSHLLLDRWSVSLIRNEVFAFYEAFCQGQYLHLERSRPYRDYIGWLQQQDLSKAAAFWQQVLKGFTTPTALGVDRARGSVLGHAEVYDDQEIRLSATTAALQSFTQRHRLTMNTLVQGAWALLLSRYSGEEEMVFGATVSGRPAALIGVESMVGLFINTLPVWVQMSSEERLLPWLKRLQNQMAELREYEYSPLVEIQGWSEVPRGLPLFESILVFENSALDGSLRRLGQNLEVRSIRSGSGGTNYPLTAVAVSGPELVLQIICDRSRFDTPTIRRMLGHWQTVLEGIVANPEQRLADVPLLTDGERQQLLVAWNATQADYPQEACIHALVEAQVDRTPDAVAVVCEDQQLTYRALNRRANQLAHHLRTLGVGPEVRVGLCLERSLELVVGVLGILKAGGAYVPLDPAYPKERLAFMLGDSQVAVLLTQERLVARLPAHKAPVVCLDSGWEVIAQASHANPVGRVTVDHLAYVIYTSGSTGRPKGVLISHSPLAHHCLEIQNHYALNSSDRVLQFASLTFDVSLEQILPTLISGARLVLRGPDVWSPTEFPQIAVALGITVADLPTAYWRQLGQAWANVVPSISNRQLRLLIVGGEAMGPEDLQRWQTTPLQGVRLLNAYGPTETTITATLFAIPPQWADDPLLPHIPIGRPCGNRALYILDRQGNPVPIGVPGELHIGGAGLARGYLNRPELTAETFIPNPFSAEAGARLYKTGDVARYLPDGNIEFLGRLDDQVKLRGFRIELGEVEAVLRQHPTVQEAVAVAREDVPGDTRLVAYLVANQPQAPSTNDLRRFLQAKLPSYMVPAAFMWLDALPLTPDGKVDRRTLPAPDQTLPELEGGFVAPRTPLESLIAEIWQDVLGVDRVGVYDNFFDLGGHSLLSMQVIGRLEKKLGLRINPRELIFQTLGQLASACEEQIHPLQLSKPMSFTKKFFHAIKNIPSRKIGGLK